MNPTASSLPTVHLPAVSDPWVRPPKRSARAAKIISLAPHPKLLQWYPEIPSIGQRIWAVWRNGKVGHAEYVGAWTYRAGAEFINEMPVAWHPENPS